MNQQVQPEKTPSKKLATPIVILIFIVLVGFLAFLGLSLRRAQAGPIAVGQQVPAFELTSFAGEKLNSKDLVGKVLVINFWASWCGPCSEEAELLEAVHQKYKESGDVKLIGVDWVDTEPKALEFIKKYNQTYFNAPDLQTKVGQMFRIQGVPETYIIDPRGKLAFVWKGPFLSEVQLTDQIEKLRTQK